MPSLNAALGLAQIKKLNSHVKKRELYLKDIKKFLVKILILSYLKNQKIQKAIIGFKLFC